MNEKDFQYGVNEIISLKGGPDFMVAIIRKLPVKKKKTFKPRDVQPCDAWYCVACSFWVHEGAEAIITVEGRR